MKTFFIPITFVISTIFLAGSCSKDEDQKIDKFNTKIELTSPIANAHFIKGDTISIKAIITSDVPIHGYEILVHKQKETPLSIKNKHTHGKIMTIAEQWIVDFTETKTVDIEIVAFIDHIGNNLSEKRKVNCN